MLILAVVAGIQTNTLTKSVKAFPAKLHETTTSTKIAHISRMTEKKRTTTNRSVDASEREIDKQTDR